MRDLNKAIIMGRIGADLNLRTTKTGLSVVQFSVATSRKHKNEANEEVQETQWHRVVAWGKQADSCARYLNKGDPVYIEGMMKSKKYEDKEGHERWSFEVHAESVSFLSQKSSHQEERVPVQNLN